MIQDGQIEIDVYKRRIKITVQARYINSLGRSDFMLHYYWLEYRNRFWRWYFKDDIVKMVRELGNKIGLQLVGVRDFSIIDGEGIKPSSIKQTTILDFGTIKEE